MNSAFLIFSLSNFRFGLIRGAKRAAAPPSSNNRTYRRYVWRLRLSVVQVKLLLSPRLFANTATERFRSRKRPLRSRSSNIGRSGCPISDSGASSELNFLWKSPASHVSPVWSGVAVSRPLRARIDVIVDGAGTKGAPKTRSCVAIFRPPHAGCSSRTLRTAISAEWGHRAGELWGFRDRSLRPASASARYLFKV